MNAQPVSMKRRPHNSTVYWIGSSPARTRLRVFAGRELRLGPPPGWKPDGIRVVMEDGGRRCTLAIIELEANASAARISARKYLPERSESVLAAFVAYLNGACDDCRRRAD